MCSYLIRLTKSRSVGYCLMTQQEQYHGLSVSLYEMLGLPQELSSVYHSVTVCVMQRITRLTVA